MPFEEAGGYLAWVFGTAAGWRFDASRELFTDGARRVDYRRVLAIMPGITMDDLASYVTQKHEEWLTKYANEKPRKG